MKNNLLLKYLLKPFFAALMLLFFYFSVVLVWLFSNKSWSESLNYDLDNEGVAWAFGVFGFGGKR